MPAPFPAAAREPEHQQPHSEGTSDLLVLVATRPPRFAVIFLSRCSQVRRPRTLNSSFWAGSCWNQVQCCWTLHFLTGRQVEGTRGPLLRPQFGRKPRKREPLLL